MPRCAKPRRAVDEKQNCGLRVGEANGLAMVSLGFTVVAVSPDRAASDHSMRARMPESVSTALLVRNRGRVLLWSFRGIQIFRQYLYLTMAYSWQADKCGEIARQKLGPAKPQSLTALSS
jgi:hypothetical protein